MRIDFVTALPDVVHGALGASICRRAGARVDVRVHALRAFAPDRQIDDYPYGGGGGMVLKPEPIFACLDALNSECEIDEVIFLSPDGVGLTQALANELSLARHLVLLAGHYKGVDQRVRDAVVTREVSIGDFVLSSGELAAVILVDAVVRLIPGVLGDASSALSDSFQDGLLGAPVYTRPAVCRSMAVPEVLLSGDHVRIAAWREAARHSKTAACRPDLFEEPYMEQSQG